MTTREISFRYDVLRSGSYYSQLYPAEDSSPVLRMDDTDAIKTALSGVFAQNDAVDWLNDRIRPVMILDGVEHALGVYLPATVTEEDAETEHTVRVEAYDQCWLVRDTCAETMFYFPAGTNYLTVVKQLLTACGIVAIAETPTTATLTEGRQDWEPGTSYLTIINQLLSEINYKSLWFSADGLAVLEPVAEPSAANIKHTLDAAQIRNLLLPHWSRTQDIYSAPNVFLCVCANPDKSGNMTATASNTNPQSPLSIPRRGRRIVSVVHVDNIASQSALQTYANRLLFDSMVRGQTVNVSTALLPGYGVDDVTALHYGDLSAVCIEHKWRMDLTVGGTMDHTLERIVYNIG